MNRLTATFVAGTLLAGIAQADISTSLVPVPNGLGPNTVTYDLVANVTMNDQWTSTSMNATVVSGAKFLFNVTAPGVTPNPAFFAVFPSLQWETMFTQPEAWPNTAGQGLPPGFAGSKVLQESQITATWFDTPPNGGDGTWVLARLSLVDLQPGWLLSLSGAHTTVKGQATLYPYQFNVPEPSTVMLLIAAGLAAGASRRGIARGARL